MKSIRLNRHGLPFAPIALAIILLTPLAGCGKGTPEESLSAIATPAEASAKAPEKIRTQQDFDRAKLAWLTRHSAESAQKAAPAGTTVDPNILDFLAHASLYELRQPKAPVLAALESEGRKLLDAGYNHPIFLRAMGRVLSECRKTSEALILDRQALQGLASQPFAKVNAFFAADQLADAVRDLYGPRSAEEAAQRQAALSALAAAIAAGEFTPAESPIAYRLIATTTFKSRLPAPWGDVYGALNGKPLDPWLEKMLQGSAELEAVWATAGSAAAPQASAQDHLALARQHLTAAWRLHPEWPEAAGKMITVALAERRRSGAESPRAWFERATHAQFDYLPAYDVLAWSLRPRWGGSYEAMAAFGRECLDSGRCETAVPLYYWAILCDIASEQPHDTGRAVFHQTGVRERLAGLLAKMLNDPAWAADRGKLLALQVVTTAWCGDYEGSRQLLAQAGPQADLDGEILNRPILGRGVNRAVFTAELEAFTGPRRDLLRQAENLQFIKQPDQALTLFTQAMNASRDNPKVFAYLRDRIAENRLTLGPDEYVDYRHGQTPLTLATHARQDEVTQFLLANGARDNILYLKPLTPPSEMASLSAGLTTQTLKQTVAAAILTPAATPTSSTAVQNSAALMASLAGNNPAQANTLIRQGAELKTRDAAGLTPLHLAVQNRQTETIRLLLENGAEVNAKSGSGHTPLHLACESGAIETVRLLLDGGADVNLASPEGWTPLSLAVQKKFPSIVRLLLDLGAKVNATDAKGAAPLDFAINNGSREIAQMLLELGAQPNHAAPGMLSPLNEAIRQGQPEIALMLIDKGAGVNTPGERGLPPLHEAVERRLAPVVSELMEKGAQPNAVDSARVTALQRAIEMKSPELVQILLSKGASARVTAPDGRTMLQVAEAAGDPQIIQLVSARMTRRVAPSPASPPALAPKSQVSPAVRPARIVPPIPAPAAPSAPPALPAVPLK